MTSLIYDEILRDFSLWDSQSRLARKELNLRFSSLAAIIVWSILKGWRLILGFINS